jgi:hypothetical protein
MFPSFGWCRVLLGSNPFTAWNCLKIMYIDSSFPFFCWFRIWDGLAFSCSSFNSRVECLAYIMMILELTLLHIVKDVGMWSIISSICLVIHPSGHSSVLSWFVYSTENGWLCLEGLAHVAFQAFAFPVLPFSSQSGKVYEKKTGKKENMFMMEK